MFVFCANMHMVPANGVEPTNTWAMRFSNRILMYNHQDDLLPRMVLEIASYFFRKAEALAEHRELDDARQHLSWAAQMYRYRRYGTIAERDITTELTAIEERMKDIEQLRQHDSDRDAVGQACDE